MTDWQERAIVAEAEVERLRRRAEAAENDHCDCCKAHSAEVERLSHLLSAHPVAAQIQVEHHRESLRLVLEADDELGECPAIQNVRVLLRAREPWLFADEDTNDQP